jgi:hypothetical protein
VGGDVGFALLGAGLGVVGGHAFDEHGLGGGLKGGRDAGVRACCRGLGVRGGAGVLLDSVPGLVREVVPVDAVYGQGAS